MPECTFRLTFKFLHLAGAFAPKLNVVIVLLFLFPFGSFIICQLTSIRAHHYYSRNKNRYYLFHKLWRSNYFTKIHKSKPLISLNSMIIILLQINRLSQSFEKRL